MKKNYAALESGWIPGHEDAFKPNAVGKIRLYDMGGGGSAPAPAPSSVSQTTIPEYAQPYVERTLGKAEALTGAPYQAYGGERYAGATPEQQAARQQVAGMQAPTQFGTGTELATQAGLTALGAGQYAPGVFAAPLTEASRLRQYQMEQPGAFGGEQAQQYMSPYMQQVVDVQKQEAIRAAQQGQLAQNLAAARQGTYGGARQLLATTERERNLAEQLGRIQATGTESAFQQAQQQFERDRAARMLAGQQNLAARLGVQQLGATQSLEAQRANQAALLQAQQLAEQSRQYGAGLGLQGAQAATQAGATLGQLGIGQQQQAIDLAKAQEAFGAMGQAERQKAMDIAYQDFIQQQQYPYKQLGFMSDILRGSANLAATGGKTIYEPPPSLASQVGGLGLAGLGIYNLLK